MTLQEATPARNGRVLILSLFLVISLMGLCGLSVLLVIFASNLPHADASEQLTFVMLAGGLFLIALLLVPAIYINTRLFVGWPALNLRLLPLNESIESIVLMVLALFWGLTLLLGQALASTPLAVIALPVLNVLAVLLPVIFFLRLALRRLNAPTMQQAWTVIAVTLVISPVLSMLLEALALGFLLLLVALLASGDAVLAQQISNLIGVLQHGGGSSDALTPHLMPLLFTPAGLLTAFGLLSVAAPIIEEGVKVLAFVLFADRIKHPVQGFVLGALCGAAFALAENVGFSSTGASEWMQSVIDRATAILPHTLNSGILGWALVSAWRERAYFKLVGAYFAVILLHGAWNGINIALALSSLTEYASPAMRPIFASTAAYTVGQILMMLGTFGGLIYANHILRRSQPAQAEYNVPPATPNSPDNGETNGIP